MISYHTVTIGPVERRKGKRRTHFCLKGNLDVDTSLLLISHWPKLSGAVMASTQVQILFECEGNKEQYLQQTCAYASNTKQTYWDGGLGRKEGGSG